MPQRAAAATDDAVRGPLVVDLEGLQVLVDVLRGRGMQVSGPQVRDGVVAVRELTDVDQLPVGWVDAQAPGRYRLDHTDRGARFGWAVGPQTWKPLLHPPEVTTASVDLVDGRAVSVHVGGADEHTTTACFGMRPCELAAIARLDRVLLAGEVAEPVYGDRRAAVFVVAADCTAPAATCFCTSMGTGPAVPDDDAVADLRLTEVSDPDDETAEPRYVVRARSAAGRDVLAELLIRAATSELDADTTGAVERAHGRAVQAIERRLDADRVVGALRGSHDDERWGAIAERCLACGNCTAVCPTCFCTATDHVTDLSGTVAETRRRWDSCYSLEFTRLGERIVRSSVTSRYRHWLVHKLDTWHDQFGESGCVGCGRCITWCPVGIDLTEEVPALLAGSSSGGSG